MIDPIIYSTMAQGLSLQDPQIHYVGFQVSPHNLKN